MDWLFQPLLLLSIFVIVLGTGCQIEECSQKYNMAMEQAGEIDHQKSRLYCEIVQAYQKCIKSVASACRGDLNYHGSEFFIKKLMQSCYPPKGSGSGITKGIKNESHNGQSESTSLPSCKYFGKHKYRHCSFFGDPHLKTFDRRYQTCRVRGTWTLLDNPFMSAQVTNKPVLAGSPATAPTKIVVVVKGSVTPCTLAKSYEADSESPLPSTFVDGTNRPGSDETVSLKWRQHEDKNGETVTIYMKYIASTLTIRRVGKYLAFMAKLPEEVVNTSRTDYDTERTELCEVGCPLSEQLKLEDAREYVMSRELALSRCKNTDDLSYEIKNNLTDSYLDWCLFDVMTSGMTYDFVAVAHLAQSDALSIDPGSLQNRTIAMELPTSSSNQSAFQLPMYICTSIYLLSMYLL